jgi:hypothetical protein
MREREPAAVNDEAEQHVIDVTAVARHVDDLGPTRDLRKAVQVAHVDAFIEPVP